ncbi:hypothetical protein JXC34_03935 [Candidatus Woesearchaeota archaeon]|nr:hypothetical protein [Candidatus Woesearchaeota archaeon]
MKRKTVFLLVPLVFFAVAILLVLIYNLFLIREVRAVVADVNINTEYVGMDGDIDGLHFGAIKVPGESERDVFVKPDEDSFVMIKVTGDVKDVLFVEGKPSFFAKGGENTLVTFKVIAEKGIDLGKREGVVYFYLMHPVTGTFLR